MNQDGYQAHYGINVAKVVEIIRRQPVTAMPEMRHPAIRGAFSHRNGRIVPLIDMAQFLGSEPVENEEVVTEEINTTEEVNEEVASATETETSEENVTDEVSSEEEK